MKKQPISHKTPLILLTIVLLTLTFSCKDSTLSTAQNIVEELITDLTGITIQNITSTGDDQVTISWTIEEAASAILTWTPDSGNSGFYYNLLVGELTAGSRSFSAPISGTIDIRIVTHDGTAHEKRLAITIPPENSILEWSAPVVQTDEGEDFVELTVLRSGKMNNTVRVSYRTADGTAQSGADYTAASEVLLFAPDETEKRIRINLDAEDQTQEITQDFQVELHTPLGDAILGSDSTVTVEILDNEDKPSLQINGPRQVSEDAGSLSLTLDLDAPVVGESTIITVLTRFLNTANSAQQNDFTPIASTQIEYLAGETSKSLSIPILDDNLYENDEVFELLVSTTSRNINVINAQQTTLTITNDESAPVVSFTAPTRVDEEDSIDMVFSIPAPSGVSTVIPVVSTTQGTASSPEDFDAINQRVTIPAGQTQATLSLPTKDDELVDGVETIIFNLGPAENGIFAEQNLTVEIHNTNLLSLGFLNSIPSIEENAPQETNVVTIGLNGLAPVGGVQAQWTINAGTAVLNTDYSTESGSITIPEGERQVSITSGDIGIINNDVDEDTRTLIITLENPTGARLGTNNTSTISLVDDDVSPILSLTEGADDVAESAGDVQLTATFNGSSQRSLSARWVVSSENATEGSDYSNSTGTLVFAPGETSKNFVIQILDDSLDEINEELTVRLEAIDDLRLGETISHTFSITDNDDPPSMSVQVATSVDEDVSGGNITATFTLDAPSSLSISADYATADDTAIAGTDYTATSGRALFAPGETSATVDIPIINDVLVEDDKSFNFVISNIVNATFSGTLSQSITIVNDDLPTVTITGLTVTEVAPGPNDQVTIARFTLSEPLDEEATVNYLFIAEASSINYAFSQGQDLTVYRSNPPDASYGARGTIRFAAGEVSKDLQAYFQDSSTYYEGTESLTIELRNPSTNITLGNTRSAVRVQDKDPKIPVTFSGNVTIDENGGAQQVANITVPSNRVLPVTLTITLTHGGFRATDISSLTHYDFTAQTNTLTFPVGTNSRELVLTPVDDNISEGYEAMLINFRIGSHGRVSGTTSSTSRTIRVEVTDNDFLFSSQQQVSADEDDGSVTVDLTYSDSSNKAVPSQGFMVDWAITAPDTLANPVTLGTDIPTPHSGTITISGGTRQKGSLTINITDDDIQESSEQFIVTWSNFRTTATGINFLPFSSGFDQATVTINDDD
ncbi:MAG: hypothetical protein MI717_12950 [Spirochaetales bacterium]|nr:hypothetical protein [Spirochaetales bacterium]